MLVANDVRRTHRRRREVGDAFPETLASSAPGPEGEVLQREAISQLDAILDAMARPIGARAASAGSAVTCTRTQSSGKSLPGM